MMGMKMILSADYISLADPGTLFIIFILWLCGDILSVVLNFIVIKLKFY